MKSMLPEIILKMVKSEKATAAKLNSRFLYLKNQVVIGEKK